MRVFLTSAKEFIGVNNAFVAFAEILIRAVSKKVQISLEISLIILILAILERNHLSFNE